MPIYQLSDDIIFPPPELAIAEGLLAVGGDLSVERLLAAYSMGIFPWYSDDEPIMWWSPDPRLVLFPEEFHRSRSLKKLLAKNTFTITADQAFDDVIAACAKSRTQNNEGTWIVDDMLHAYAQLHKAGFAHSFEAWHDGNLAGGLYGVSLGGIFFGESMFTIKSNASKAALSTLIDFLQKNSFDLIDCQVTTSHFESLGAREIPRKKFLKTINLSITNRPTLKGKWVL